VSDQDLIKWLEENPWDTSSGREQLYREEDFRAQYMGEWAPTPIAVYTREYIDNQVRKGAISLAQGEELIRYRYSQLKNDEKSLAEVMTNEGIAPWHQKSIMRYLDTLRHHHVGTYLHSIRVGVLAAKIAAFADLEGVSPKMMLWAGLLHDVGKAQIPVTLLEKVAGFSEADREAMEPHVVFGWQLIQEVHDHTAHIIVRHHRHGKRPYPETLPPLPAYLQSRRDIVEDASRLLALADYYDALTTRQNDRNGGEGLSKEQKRELYFRENPGFEPLIQKLEAAGVFTFEE